MKQITINNKKYKLTQEQYNYFKSNFQKLSKKYEFDWDSLKNKKSISSIITRLAYLSCRWKDEKEYEDFNDYITDMTKIVEDLGFIFLKLTKTFKLTICEKDSLKDIIITNKGISQELNIKRILKHMK